MKKPRLIVVGGFLGAGKTTCILKLSKRLINEGKKIGIVTNDQGSSLVDTNFLASEGLDVLEVTGGCFCCNFDEFAMKVERLAEDGLPDVILAEPVGSCTDLVATIFKPLQFDNARKFDLSPLSVVVDPKRVKKLMMDKGRSLFPDEINYLFQKQLEEADLIVLNKIDMLNPDHKESLMDFLKDKCPGADVISVSAREDTGFESWLPFIMVNEAPVKNSMEINYETYGAAEAFLGWLNSSARLDAKSSFDMNKLVEELMNNIKGNLMKKQMEIAHLKVYGIGSNDFIKAGLTSLDDEVEYTRKMSVETKSANIIVNARVNSEPELLAPIIENGMNKIFEKYLIKVKDISTECFKPSMPKPKYRMD